MTVSKKGAYSSCAGEVNGDLREIKRAYLLERKVGTLDEFEGAFELVV